MKKKEFKGLDLIAYDVDMNVQDLTSLANRILETRGKSTKKTTPSILGHIETPDNMNQDMYNEIIKKVRQVLPSSNEVNIGRPGSNSQVANKLQSVAQYGTRHRKEV